MDSQNELLKSSVEELDLLRGAGSFRVSAKRDLNQKVSNQEGSFQEQAKKLSEILGLNTARRLDSNVEAQGEKAEIGKAWSNFDVKKLRKGGVPLDYVEPVESEGRLVAMVQQPEGNVLDMDSEEIEDIGMTHESDKGKQPTGMNEQGSQECNARCGNPLDPGI
ncbi:OLC1v1026335C1 [Oldenlandia corymbosa var. corymbosa]|uniref:OLC1v1026335C1 n=1 Tax=Oldenlandia corymbosa var. corymbosa TaxID=529605 RepID=A0AAV1C6S1_OLDCO|nr:OLC1v1026335C1 [Oldenlandia corymbosa var. corymbosa]